MRARQVDFCFHTVCEIYARAPDQSVVVTIGRTDVSGEARFAVEPGYTYLVDAVVIRPGSVEGAIYDTLWAALTFHVP